MRESNPAKAAESDGWTAEKVRAMRTKTPTAGLPSQSPDGDSSPKVGALGRTGKFVQTAQAATNAKDDILYADALDSYRAGEAMARQSPAVKWGEPLISENVLENPASGAKAYGTSLAQKQKQYNDQHSQTDEFDAINQWLDTGDNKNLADAVRRVDNTHGAYTDKDLITKGGWTQEQIDTARQMNAALDAIPAWRRGVRRTANTIGGVADTVAAAPFLAGEYTVQAGKNLAQSAANRKALEAEVAKSPREKNLYERLMETDMEYQPRYSTGDLLQQGFTREEIDSMKARIAGTEAQDSVDPEKSFGYQLYHRGQQLNAAAQSGLSPVGRTALGVATSTAENLAVAGVNPAAVLPVLSAQGAAEAMGQSVESGQSAGKALAGGLAKFGAGWAINSVGAADLARTMGSDYAKDTVAGQIADWVRGLAGDGTLAKSYPAVANAISGGMDNAMQAFVETYADQAIDAALGDEEAAKTMFSKETFLNALESGLSGGASGALGGAVGTGLAKYNSGDSSLRGQAEYYAAQADAKQAARQQRKALERTMEPGEAAAAQTPASSQKVTQPAQQAAQNQAVENAGESVDKTALTDQQREAQSQEASTADSSSDGALARQDLSVTYGDTSPDRGGLGMSGNSEQDAQVLTDAEERAPLPRVESAETQNQAVKNTGESVESSPAELRETIGLQEAPTENQKMNRVEQKLRSWQVSEKAAENLSKQMPGGLNADTYAAAASSMYRLGQMEDVDTFDKALRLAGSENALGLNVNMVLEKSTGRNVLEQAYLYGKGEQEARTQQMKKLGGALGAQSTSGEGVTYYRGTLRPEDAVASQIISLNAQGTGTDAVLKSVLNGPDGAPNANVRAYVDTETARIFFGDSAQDVFSTVLHEDYHWYNALDAEGAKTLQDHALLYLAQKNGYENIDEMIRAKMGDYAAQSLTYEQAAEELVADAWGGIFDSEESVRRWAQFQRAQADKNAGRAGGIHKVMQQVKTMLENIISKAKEVLRIDPENTAARKAQRLAEAEKRALQEEYFAHAEKAMDNLRAAKASENKNAAALKTEDAAEKLGTRFEIDRNFAKNVDAIDLGVTWSKRIRVGATSEVLKSIGVKDQNIYWDSGKIRKILQKHSAENFRAGMDDSIMTREIIKQVPQVLESPIVVLHSDTSRNADYASRIYMFGEVYDQTGKPVDVSLELLPTSRGGLEMDNIVVTSAYGKKNVQGLLNRDEILYIDPNKNRTNTWLAVNRLQLPLRITKYGSIASLRYSDGNVKSVSVENTRTDEPVKKTTRFQLASPVEVNGEKELIAVHNLTEENLREALDLGGMPSPSIAVVKARNGHSKYGPISLVFGPDSIDPMANRANRVYGSDAWTPTRPSVEYKVNADQAMKLNTELAQLSRQTAKGAFARGSVLTGTLNMEASSQSPKQLAGSLAQNDAVKAAYLADKDEDIQVVTKPEVRFTESQKKRYEKIMEAIGGESVLRDIVETDVVSGNHDRANAVLNEVRQAETAWAMEELGWSEEKAQAKAARLIAPMLRSRLENAYEYVTTKDIAGKLVQDTDAMQQELREKAPDADVASWLLPKMEKILGEKGIYNGKDPYTKQGNRRSFAQLHNPYTLENLVAAMNQEEARGKGAWGLSANTLMSTATAEYKNLDEVRADKGRLQQMPEEEYKALLEKADGQIETILSKLRSETEPHTSNSFEEREILGDILLRAAQGSQTTTAIGKAFAKEGYSISKDTAALIRQLYKDVAAIPTGYFEAKPQRAVGFEEVKAAILPDNASAALVDSLKGHGIAVEQYKAGDEAQRAELLNKVPNVRFQMAESADRDARKNTQRQASRAIAERDASLKTLMDFFGITRGVRISDDSLEGMALRIIKGSGAKGKLHSSEFAKELRPLVEYLKADGADMQKAQSMAEVLAGEVLDHATYRKALPDSEKARALQDRLQQRINETENRVYLPMTVDQMRMLKAITASTLHVIRTANKTLSLEKAKEVDAFAQRTAHEVLAAKGNEPGSPRLQKALTLYNLDMLGAKRVFRMLGGYTKDGQMEQLADILNEGQRKQTQITVEGTALFDNVTGKANVKNMEQFAGPGAELVDVGLKDTKGTAVPLTHAQLCSLYMHLKNADSRNHLLAGGLTLPDAKAYHKGDIEAAYQKGQTVQLGSLLNADGTPMADTIVQTVEKAMTDYDRAWCKDMEDFFGRYTTNLINETSMKLLGYQRATVKNYYPIAVDKTQLATQIEGLKLDATIEGRGFLKNRVKSSQPILLEECNNVVQRSLRDTAAYAGLAAPIRDVQKILNSGVETAQGVGILKNKIIKEHWGREAVDYIDYLLTDLQSTQRKRMDGVGRGLGKLRGNYAGAILTLNPGVAIAQAASLPTAGAVLGADTMAAVVPFVKNLSGKQRAALEAEISQHGDVLLRYRMRSPKR